MKREDFNPHVRYIYKVTKRGLYPQRLLAYDFRMFYVLKGSFTFESEDTAFRVVEGDLLTVPPATPYKLLYDEGTEPIYYIVNFDFISVSDQFTPRPPVPIEQFKPDKIFSKEYYDPFGEIFLLHNAHIAEKVLEEILFYNGDSSEHSKNLQSALLKYLLTRTAILKESTENHSTNAGLVEKVKQYIDENFKYEMTNQSVAAYFGYHPYHLNTIFLEAEKETLHKYIAKVRLKCARDMLIHSDKRIGDIAYECGFKDSSYFCKFFLKYMKLTPKQYRNLAK